MKALLDIAQALIITLIVLAVALIVIDTALQFADARPDNEIVAFVGNAAETLTPQPAVDVVDDQEFWQTALFSVVAWALAVVFFLLVFSCLRALADYARRRRRDQP